MRLMLLMHADTKIPIPALSRDWHRIWSGQPQGDYGFAHNMPTVATSLSEAALAVACFSLVFVVTASGQRLRAPLHRSASDHTVFVATEELWNATRLLRRLYVCQFDLTSPLDGVNPLGIREESNAALNGPCGLVIFVTDDGVLATDLSAPLDLAQVATWIAARLHRQARQLSSSYRAARWVERFGLLSQLYGDPGLRIIDADAPARLPEAHILDMYRSGAIGLNADFVSLTHRARMAWLEATHATGTLPLLQKISGANVLFDLLSAFSDAYSAKADHLWPHGVTL